MHRVVYLTSLGVPKTAYTHQVLDSTGLYSVETVNIDEPHLIIAVYNGFTNELIPMGFVNEYLIDLERMAYAETGYNNVIFTKITESMFHEPATRRILYNYNLSPQQSSYDITFTDATISIVSNAETITTATMSIVMCYYDITQNRLIYKNMPVSQTTAPGQTINFSVPVTPERWSDKILFLVGTNGNLRSCQVFSQENLYNTVVSLASDRLSLKLFSPQLLPADVETGSGLINSMA